MFNSLISITIEITIICDIEEAYLYEDINMITFVSLRFKRFKTVSLANYSVPRE